MGRRGDGFFSNYIITILCVILGLMILGKLVSIFGGPKQSNFSSTTSSTKYSSSSNRHSGSSSSSSSGYAKSTVKPATKPYSASKTNYSSSKAKSKTVDPMDHDIDIYYSDYKDEFENEDDAWDDFEDDDSAWDDY